MMTMITLTGLYVAGNKEAGPTIIMMELPHTDKVNDGESSAGMGAKLEEQRPT